MHSKELPHSVAEYMTCNYNDLKLEGEGSFGQVYVGTTRKGAVAIKIVDFRTKEAKAQYTAELKLYKRLNHKNICSLKKSKRLILKNGPHLKQFGLYEMEKMDSDLLSIIMTRGLSDIEKKLVFREICEGVAYLHSQGIAHLDLKPDNILLRFNAANMIEEVKLCDFGFSRRCKLACDGSFLPSLIGRFGTLLYVPPECVESNRGASMLPIFLDKADIYALGVILFIFYTGTFPKVYDDEGDVLGIQSLANVHHLMPEEAFDLISQLMDEDPYFRPTIDEVLDHDYLY